MKTRIGFVSNSSSSSFVILVQRDKLQKLLDGETVDGYKLSEWEQLLLSDFKKYQVIHQRIVLGDIREFTGATYDNLCPCYPQLNPEQYARFAKEFNLENKEVSEWDDSDGWNLVWEGLFKKFIDGQTIYLSTH